MSSETKVPAETDATAPVAAPLKRRAPTLYAIIIFKLVKAVLFLALAAILYCESDNDMPADYQNFLQKPSVKFVLYHLKIHPESKFFTALAEKIGKLTEAKVRWAALGTVLLSLFPLIEGIGMLFRVPWAGWLAIGESAFFVPIEFYKLTTEKTFSWSILVVTIANIIIVWYLYAYRAVLFHHHHPNPPKAV